VPEIARDDIRQLLYGDYRIIYRIDPRRVVILTVRHGRRRWDLEELDAHA
jgi:plasmid stabilization system protein ParE